MRVEKNLRRNLFILVPVLILGGLLGARMFSTSAVGLVSFREYRDGSMRGGKHHLDEETPGDRTRRAVVEHATPQKFDAQVLRSSVPVPVLVDFYADWCVSCHMQREILNEVAAELDGVRIVKVNVDESHELAWRFQVDNLPTLMIINDGEVVARQVGVVTKEKLIRALAG